MYCKLCRGCCEDLKCWVCQWWDAVAASHTETSTHMGSKAPRSLGELWDEFIPMSFLHCFACSEFRDCFAGGSKYSSPVLFDCQCVLIIVRHTAHFYHLFLSSILSGMIRPDSSWWVANFRVGRLSHVWMFISWMTHCWWAPSLLAHRTEFGSPTNHWFMRFLDYTFG